jgi:hypothetical protein
MKAAGGSRYQIVDLREAREIFFQEKLSPTIAEHLVAASESSLSSIETEVLSHLKSRMIGSRKQIRSNGTFRQLEHMRQCWRS